MKKIKFTKENIPLILILILSAILNFTNLGIEDYANTYYAASVKSMTMSFKNFFFVSFDPGSFVSIDKPPLGFWIQAISAKIFGFSGWSIILPQALAGVISVALIYYIVKRSFGSPAALISALCLAVTPIFVAVSRNNTIDNLLVMTLLFACLALSKAAENGKLKYLIISLVFVGVGFNIKMLEAYMVVPALYITYLISSSVPVKKRIKHLVVGSFILIFISLSWALLVDLVPAANRPFVGSSTNNSVMELIIGHNGLERLGIGGNTHGGRQGGNGQGQMANGSGNQNGQGQRMPEAASNDDGQRNGNLGPGDDRQGGRNQGMPNGSNGNGQRGPGGNWQGGMPQGSAPGNRNAQQPGGGSFGGQEKASIIRLFSNNSLSDQIIWFLPLAIFGFIAAALKEKLKRPFDNKRKLLLILLIAWLIPEFIYFSYTKGLFHPYYLTMLAAPIAALTGIGLVTMWHLYREGGKKALILPGALIVDGLVQMIILSYYYNISNITKIIMIILPVLCFISSIILIINLIKGQNSIDCDNSNALQQNIKLNKRLVIISLIGILIAPTVWSAAAIFYKMSGTFPSAGLELASNNGMNNFGYGGLNNPSHNVSNNTTEKLIQYLQKNKKNEKYLVAVPSAMNYASDIIIQTGQPVMTLGGFSGSDKILTLNEFKKLIDEGDVRYAVVENENGRGNGGSSEIINWIRENGRAISESEWSDSSSSNNEESNIDSNTMNANVNNDSKNSSNIQGRMDGGFGGRGSVKLYDLKENISTIEGSI